MSGHKTTALVTGADSGLGVEFCRQLADRCQVIIAVAARLDQLHSLRAEINAEVEFHLVQADLPGIEGVAQTLEILRQKGPVDILVNGAGATPSGEFSDVPIEAQLEALNLRSDLAVMLSHAAIPFMRQQGGGRIINISSPLAFIPARGRAVSGGSLAFLSYFSQVLREELEGTGIRIQVLCPGRSCPGLACPGLACPESAGTGRAEPGGGEPPPGNTFSGAVSASLAALDGDELFIFPEEEGRALAAEGVRNLLAALGGKQ